MATGLPPPPINDQPGSFTWLEWYRQLRNYISTNGSVPWYVINFAGSNITDIATRDHDQLQNLDGGTAGEHYHLTAAEYAALTAGDHNDLTGLQGGTTDEYYHLTSAQWSALGTSGTVSSGTYNPTVTNSNNVASVDAVDLFLWSRAGDIVTTSGKVLITPTTSGVETRFLITLPVTSNLASTDDLTGVMNVRKSSGEQWPGVVAGDSSDKALTRYTPNLTGSHYCYVTFQFIVK